MKTRPDAVNSPPDLSASMVFAQSTGNGVDNDAAADQDNCS